MKLSVKKGDNVLVIAGKDAGKTGEVLENIANELKEKAKRLLNKIAIQKLKG